MPTTKTKIAYIFSQMEKNSFEYEPLKGQKGAFRLLRLKKGVGRNIECELVHTTLDKENQYEALSYTWGSTEKADTIDIHGKQLHITLNLSVILRDIRSPKTDRMLWIDAICINQEDKIERGCQVQQMRNIFGSAERVLFYISEPTRITEFLMIVLESFQKEILKNLPNSNLNRNWSDWTFENAELVMIWQKVQTKLKKQHYAMEQRQREGLEHVLTQPWFSRIWILQEVANARDALVYCGRRSVPASIFVVSPCLIDIRHVDNQRYQPILNLMPGPLKAKMNYHDRDLYSLLIRFSSARATDSYDKIYALLGICIDITHTSTLQADYNKSAKEVIRATVSHLCHCDSDSISEVPFASITDFFVDHVDRDGCTPLSYAAAAGHTAVVKVLLAKGANIDTRDKSARTPLSYAAAGGHAAVVELLLAEGANVEAKDNIVRTPLSYATENNHMAVIELLLAKGANIEARDSIVRTPLLFAAAAGYAAVVELLLAKGANIDVKGAKGRASLSNAAARGYEAVVELLLSNDADVEERDWLGRTPLSHATENGQRAVVELLLAKGANITAKDMDGRTPLSYASENGQRAVVKILLAKGANVERDLSGPALPEDTPPPSSYYQPIT
ncbi:ankyrin repeat-containing domain protein [Xylariales sp. PMI_506]|nr:ankyrin repeat-containing domain protein [Xylariales sp. PMI_506]